MLQIYLGNGHKFGAKTSFFPVAPPQVMADPVEDPVCDEPNGDLPKEEKPEDEGKGEDEEAEEQNEEN